MIAAPLLALALARLLITEEPPASDVDTELRLVVAAEAGLGALVPIPPTGALPMGDVRPFLALSLGRFTLQVDGTLQLGVPFVAAQSSLAALFALDASDASRFELGAGAGAGFMVTVFVEDGGGGPLGHVFLIARKQWWWDRLGFGISARLGGGAFQFSGGFPPTTDVSYLVWPSLSAHVAARL